MPCAKATTKCLRQQAELVKLVTYCRSAAGNLNKTKLFKMLAIFLHYNCISEAKKLIMTAKSTYFLIVHMHCHHFTQRLQDFDAQLFLAIFEKLLCVFDESGRIANSLQL